MLTWIATSMAATLPSIEPPVVTGLRNTTDAAVVVGISDYLRVADLPYAEGDARAFAAFAADTLGIPGSRIWQPRSKNKESIEAAVAEAGRKVGNGGTVWVYFAGYGATHPETNERLLLGDDVPADGTFGSRSASVTALEALAAVGGGQSVLIMDLSAVGQFRSLVMDPPAPRGGALEWTAVQEGAATPSLPGTGHGAFTWLVLGAFRGWADGEPATGGERGEADGVVTAREARDYVSRQLSALALPVQAPSMQLGRAPKGGSDLEAIRLVGGVGERAPTLVVAQTGPSLAEKLAALQAARDQQAKATSDHAGVMAAAVKARQDEARAAWALVAQRLAEGGPAGVAATEEFLRTFGSEQVTADGETRSVELPEVAQAEAALAAGLDAGPLVDQGTPGLGDEGVELPEGTFLMGSPAGERGREEDELLHAVSLRRFVMARTEVSQALWRAVMKEDPPIPDDDGVVLVGPSLPVLNVSWCDAVTFSNRLSALQGLVAVYGGVAECLKSAGSSVTMDRHADGWRLPTEAEWEYAARAWRTGAWGAVSDQQAVCEIGNVADVANARQFVGSRLNASCDDGFAGPAPVGSFRANRWGLHDLVGNASEWAWDRVGPYPGTAVTNPTGDSSEPERAIRGGSWVHEPTMTRVANRVSVGPTWSAGHYGFRLARSLP